MSETLKIGPYTFSVEIEDDSDNGPPWEKGDGHGPVSDWRRQNYMGHYPKRPGEIKLCSDRHSARFYDFAAAMKTAKKEQWGSEGDEVLSRGEKARKAVMADFDRLRQWCEGQWYYIGGIVTREDTGEKQSLWGIESDGDYWRECAEELARELMPDQSELPGIESKAEWQ